MLFARGIRSRGMIGLRLERQSDVARPGGTLLPRDRRGRAVDARRARRCGRDEVVVLDLRRASSAQPSVDRGATGASSRSFHFVCSCGTEASSDFVYGWSGLPKTRSVAPISTTAPRRRIIVRSLM